MLQLESTESLPARLAWASMFENYIMYYTYVLIGKKDGNFYIGFTNNIEKRVEEHSQGKVVSTANRIPLKLIYYEACLNKYDALKREKYFKSGFGRRFLKNRLEAFLTSEF